MFTHQQLTPMKLNSEQDNCAINQIPMEILAEILKHLNRYELAALSQTCRLFKPLFYDPYHKQNLPYPDIEYGEKLNIKKLLKGHKKNIQTMCVLPDGRLVSSSEDHTLIIWDNKKLKPQFILEGHSDRIYTIAALSNNTFVSGSCDKTLRIWDSKNGSCLKEINAHTERNAHTGWILTICVLPNGNFVSGSSDKSFRIWDQDGNYVNKQEDLPSSVDAIQLLTNGRFATKIGDIQIKIWNQEGDYLTTLAGSSPNIHFPLRITCMTSSKDGKKLITCANDGSICIWDTHTGHLNLIKDAPWPEIKAVVILDNNHFATASDKTIKIWDNNKNCIKTLTGHKGTVSHLKLLPDNKTLLSASYDYSVKLWDIDSGQCIKSLFPHTRKNKPTCIQSLEVSNKAGAIFMGLCNNFIDMRLFSYNVTKAIPNADTKSLEEKKENLKHSKNNKKRSCLIA